MRSNNKLARLANERREKLRSAGVADEPTIEDQLVRVEEDIRRALPALSDVSVHTEP